MAKITYFSFKNFACEAFSYLKTDMKDGIIVFDRVQMSNICVRMLHVKKDFSSNMSIVALVMVIIDEHIIF